MGVMTMFLSIVAALAAWSIAHLVDVVRTDGLGRLAPPRSHRHELTGLQHHRIQDVVRR